MSILVSMMRPWRFQTLISFLLSFVVILIYGLIDIGSTMLKLDLELHQRTIWCKLIQEVTYYGLIVPDVTNAPQKVTSVYSSLTLHLKPDL